MKKATEQMAERAVKVLRNSLSRNVEDIKVVLDKYESEHAMEERDRSHDYMVLVAGQMALEELIETIDNRLND